jgi:hypothetical protein
MDLAFRNNIIAQSDLVLCFKKSVDWSLLNEGITIPVDVSSALFGRMPLLRERGHSQAVKFIIEGKPLEATIKNVDFNQSKYPSRTDILQFRYSPKSSVAGLFKTTFKTSYEYLQRTRSKNNNLSNRAKVLDSEREYIVIYFTHLQDVLTEIISSLNI